MCTLGPTIPQSLLLCPQGRRLHCLLGSSGADLKKNKGRSGWEGGGAEPLALSSLTMLDARLSQLCSHCIERL